MSRLSSTIEYSREAVLEHYYICCLSRACSVLARKEVLTGKAKFGIIGDGKELPQVALATQFAAGDWRSGYYRDQTLMLALGLCTPQDLFAQLYADTEADPFSGGRQMNSHFATRTIDDEGKLLPLAETFNISADISSTAGQMARGLGLAQASKKFRRLGGFENTGLTNNGKEICWVTIGDASTSEGVFWESLNAAGVMQVPMVVSVWDDGYGISVPIEFQTTKSSISEALAGLQREGDSNGIEILTARAWNYTELMEAYEIAAQLAREKHVPVLVHVKEVTQQLGHSTSGSHERYKSAERLQFEKEHDCNVLFGNWIINQGFASQQELDAQLERADKDAKNAQAAAWETLQERIRPIFEKAISLVPENSETSKKLASAINPGISEILAVLRRFLLSPESNSAPNREEIAAFAKTLHKQGVRNYESKLYQEGERSVTNVKPEPAEFESNAPLKPGYQLLNTFFDSLFERDRRVLAFGEDVGHIGDVNQGFANLQDKYGKERIFDTGIREWTIVGQAIGLALRGFRPIAEIQYLDYLVYAISPLTDDLATLLYRSNGQQQAPVIVRTRGHRLEGIWHSGSPLGMMINSLRGVVICVPRNMLQAVGMYNALMKANEPGIVIETLNAYRIRERVPNNIETYTVAIGRPDIIRSGEHLTLLTYGACTPVCEKACDLLAEQGVNVELIDAQTLLPFDIEHQVVKSIEKTSRLLIVDEDVPGGASAFLLRHILDVQKAFPLLDAAPMTLTAKAHRTPYGSDGDYFTKPSVEDVIEKVLQLIAE